MKNERILATPTGSYNLPRLREEAASVGVTKVNEIDGGEQLAFYFPDTAPVGRADVENLLASHDSGQPSKSEQDAQSSQDRQEFIRSFLNTLDLGEATGTEVQQLLAALAREVMGA